MPGASTACFDGIKLLVSNPIESQPIKSQGDRA